MDVNLYLLLALLATLLVIAYLLTRLHRVRGQLSLIKDALMDIKSGNLNRRVLVRESDMTKQICYDINEIAMSSQSRLIQQKQSEQAYKRLMTSLSHDVKTPLASLVGYLEAVESKMVTGAEQEEYIRVAAEKAHHLKEFVTVLFEWVKLDKVSAERQYVRQTEPDAGAVCKRGHGRQDRDDLRRRRGSRHWVWNLRS